MLGLPLGGWCPSTSAAPRCCPTNSALLVRRLLLLNRRLLQLIRRVLLRVHEAAPAAPTLLVVRRLLRGILHVLGLAVLHGSWLLRRGVVVAGTLVVAIASSAAALGCGPVTRGVSAHCPARTARPALAPRGAPARCDLLGSRCVGAMAVERTPLYSGRRGARVALGGLEP